MKNEIFKINLNKDSLWYLLLPIFLFYLPGCTFYKEVQLMDRVELDEAKGIYCIVHTYDGGRFQLNNIKISSDTIFGSFLKENPSVTRSIELISQSLHIYMQKYPQIKLSSGQILDSDIKRIDVRENKETLVITFDELAELSNDKAIQTTWGKFFVVHTRTNMYAIEDMTIDSGFIRGTVKDIRGTVYYSPKRLGKRVRENEESMLSEVHVFMKDDAPIIKPGSQHIPIEQVERITIVKEDKALLIGLGTALGIAGSLSVVWILSNAFP